jgi:hypothetical protein
LIQDNTVVDLLWETISKMSLGERFAFRRNIPANKEPIYIKLYDAIIEKSYYNETELKQELAHILPDSKYIYNKHILLQKLLENNAAYMANSSPKMQVLSMLQIILSLRQKSQLALANKYINKAIQLCKQNNFIAMLVLCYEEKIKLELFNKNDTNLATITKTVEDTKLIYSNNDTLHELQYVYIQLMQLRKNAHILMLDKDKQMVTNLEQHLYNLYVPEAQSLLLKHYYCMSHAIICIFKGSYTQAYTFLIDNINNWHKHNIQEEIEYYLDALNLCLDACIFTNNLDKCNELIAHTLHHSFETDYGTNNFAMIRFRTINRMLNRQGKYDEVAQFIKKEKSAINKWISRVNVEYQITSNGSLAISNFVLKEYNEAFYYGKQMLLSFNNAQRKEALSFAYLFITMITFEAKNHQQFQSASKNAYTHFYRHSSPFLFEKKFLQVINKAYLNRTGADIIKKWQKLYDELEKLEQDGNVKYLLNLFNFKRYIQSKIQKKEYLTLAKEEQGLV